MSDKIKAKGCFKFVDFDDQNTPIGTIVFNVENNIPSYKSSTSYKILSSKESIEGPFKRLIFERENTLSTYLLDVDVTFLDQLKRHNILLDFKNFKTDVVLFKFDENTYSCYLDIKLEPKVGNFCLHYNYLSEILEVHPIEGKKSEYFLKMKTFYDEGTMTHTSSMFTLINCNRKNLAKTIRLEA